VVLEVKREDEKNYLLGRIIYFSAAQRTLTKDKFRNCYRVEGIPTDISNTCYKIKNSYKPAYQSQRILKR